MYASIQTEAILLRRVTYSETDLVISFLTSSGGLVDGIARGARKSRKRFIGGLEPFHVLSITYKERARSQLAFVSGSNIVREYENLTSSYDKLVISGYLCELVRELAKGTSGDEGVFALLDGALDRLGSAGETFELANVTCRFELKLLRVLGFLPRLDACHSCERPLAAAGTENGPRGSRISLSWPGPRVMCARCRTGVIGLYLDGTNGSELEVCAAHPLIRLVNPLSGRSVGAGREIARRTIQELLGKTPRAADAVRDILNPASPI